METSTWKTALVVAWVALGVAQVVYGLVRGDTAVAVFGGGYALLGVGYFWAEVYAGRASGAGS